MYETVLTVNYALTLVPLQGSWLHVCLAISCINNRLSAVVNGQKIEDIQLPEAEGYVCPLSLFRRLILFKGFGSRGIWHQVRAKVTNLNIYSSQLPLESMKKKTSGEICGQQDGDYLSWSNSSWKLTGAATWTDIEVEDLCRKESNINVFTGHGATDIDHCTQLCTKLHKQSRMPLFGQMGETLRNIQKVTIAPRLVVWIPMIKENDEWVDIYTRIRTPKLEWNGGFPLLDSSRICAKWSPLTKGYGNFPCRNFDPAFCTCQFSEHPFLTLRGLCKESYIDQTYLPKNNPTNGELMYNGNIGSNAQFLNEDNQWKIDSAFYNFTAVSDAASGQFMLGRQDWAISGDSKKCLSCGNGP